MTEVHKHTSVVEHGPDGPVNPAPDEDQQARPSLLVVSLLVVSVPFLAVTFPPVTDLAQHVAQVRLFHDALGSGGPYEVQWLTPYLIVYAMFAAWWEIVPAMDVGRFAMATIGVAWVVAIHGLARAFERPATNASLACLLFFGLSTYWGFVSFLAGFPVFAAWVWFLERRVEPNRLGTLAAGAVLAGFLYFSHALWFAVGTLWLIVRLGITRQWRQLAWRSIPLTPFILLAAVWFPTLSARGFTNETVFNSTSIEKLSFGWLIENTFGGISGWVEPVVASVIGCWAAAAIWRAASDDEAGVDLRLLGASALFAALALLLPYRFQNTVEFANRWVTFGAIFVLLSLPAPSFLRARTRSLAVAAMSMAFCAVLVTVWVAAEDEGYSGMPEALERLPENRRVIGLCFEPTSQYIRRRPWMQGFAYAQVAKPTELNFSFAEFAPLPVVFSEPTPPPWTQGLEWFPHRVTNSDFRQFDFALVCHSERGHSNVARHPLLAPLTAKGRWRLYRIGADGP